MSAKIQVYQVYYQEKQKENLFLDAIPYYNQELSIFFENDIILELYQNGKIIEDYFGVLSWKVRKKNLIYSNYLRPLLTEQYNFYSFTYDQHDVLGYAEDCHPGFYQIFRELLKYLNIDVDTRPKVGLYQNAIITKPKIYIDYVENFLVPTIDFFKNCSEDIQHILLSNANYRGVSVEKLENSIGLPHYPYHTFILERLWSLYYHNRRRKGTTRYYWSKLNINSYRSIKVNSKGKLHKRKL